jgi:YHS domain-containing protein
VQDPARYLVERGVVLRCPVARWRRARLEPALEARLGQDLFYFSSARARAAFLRRPWLYARRLTDPVTRTRFRFRRDSPRAESGGRSWYFANPQTRDAFVALPGRYVQDVGGMLPE